ncbi:MAG: tetratricopeptide repeat protein, partial [Patescibacteria group bacterium]|nr:tetratricopeptide repeat protein [Patescibacteria group bacterium]
MHRALPRCRLAATFTLALMLAVPGAILWDPAQNRASAQSTASNPYGAQSAKPSLAESFSSGVKRGWNGLTNTLSLESTPKPAPDPTSLGSHGRPSPRLHVEMARLNEHSGRLDAAEQHYQEALRMDPNDLSAMLNYARLKDRQGEPAAAFDLYRRAVDTHPREASVYNYLGLHYDRRGMPTEAAATFAQAVQLKPTEPLYRNNVAHVLVQLGKLSDAFEHLHAVHGEAVAYYNLGYLLHRRGQREAAVQHLAAALRRDPSLNPARQLLAELSPAASPPATAGRP